MWTKAALLQAASLLALSSLLIEANGLALPANSTSLVKREGGINCRGSSTCGLIGTFSNGRIVQTIDGYIGSIDYTRVYENGQQIACESNVCAFLKAFLTMPTLSWATRFGNSWEFYPSMDATTAEVYL